MVALQSPDWRSAASVRHKALRSPPKDSSDNTTSIRIRKARAGWVPRVPKARPSRALMPSLVVKLHRRDGTQRNDPDLGFWGPAGEGKSAAARLERTGQSMFAAGRTQAGITWGPAAAAAQLHSFLTFQVDISRNRHRSLSRAVTEDGILFPPADGGCSRRMRILSMSQEVAGTLGGPLLVILKSNTQLLSGAGQKHAHGDKSQEMIFT